MEAFACDCAQGLTLYMQTKTTCSSIAEMKHVNSRSRWPKRTIWCNWHLNDILGTIRTSRLDFGTSCISKSCLATQVAKNVHPARACQPHHWKCSCLGSNFMTCTCTCFELSSQNGIAAGSLWLHKLLPKLWFTSQRANHLWNLSWKQRCQFESIEPPAKANCVKCKEIVHEKQDSQCFHAEVSHSFKRSSGQPRTYVTMLIIPVSCQGSRTASNLGL